MTTAIEALRSFMTSLLPSWQWSMERLTDGAKDPAKRYGIIKSAGGGGGDPVRQPLFTLDFLGKPSGDVEQTHTAAQEAIAALRESAGPVATFEPSEPTPSLGVEGRPIYSVAVAATLIDD